MNFLKIYLKNDGKMSLPPLQNVAPIAQLKDKKQNDSGFADLFIQSGDFYGGWFILQQNFRDPIPIHNATLDC